MDFHSNVSTFPFPSSLNKTNKKIKIFSVPPLFFSFSFLFLFLSLYKILKHKTNKKFKNQQEQKNFSFLFFVYFFIFSNLSTCYSFFFIFVLGVLLTLHGVTFRLCGSTQLIHACNPLRTKTSQKKEHHRKRNGRKKGGRTAIVTIMEYLFGAFFFIFQLFLINIKL